MGYYIFSIRRMGRVGARGAPQAPALRPAYQRIEVRGYQAAFPRENHETHGLLGCLREVSVALIALVRNLSAGVDHVGFV